MGSISLNCLDLNWKNPELRKAVFDMMHWWLKKGADGFRMDVVSSIYHWTLDRCSV
jgi:glycosidase